jgi:trigger factor
MIETESERIMQNFANSLRSQGLNIQGFMANTGHTVDSLRETYREPARKNVAARLALEAIARTLNLSATEEEVDKELEEMSEDYGLDVEKLKENLSKREMATVKTDIMVHKALRLVVDNAVESAELPPVNNEEITANNE